MKRTALAVALGAAFIGGSQAQALVVLPSGALEVRFYAIAAFDLSYDPFINVQTGVPIAPIGSDGPLTLTAFGEVEIIFDANDSNNQGAIVGELTFAYTGGTLTPLGGPTLIASTTNSRTYSINSTIAGGTVTFYDDVGGANLNTANFFGQPIAVPAAATDGSVYLVAPTPDDTAASIIITYFRPNSVSNFNRYTIALQVANGGTFPITGGAILGDVPGAIGESVLVSQLGPYSTTFQTEVIPGPIIRNKSVNQLIEGSFELRITVPEPASLALLGAGAILMLSRRRKPA